MADGYAVEPRALAQVARGINDTIAELDGMAGQAGAGDVGVGFSAVALTGLQVGHAGLQEGLARFAERWGWEVNRLVGQANEIAAKLDLSAEAYHDTEVYAGGVVKAVAADLLADPHATEPAEGQSWSQLYQHGAGQLSHPDWSSDSLARAADHTGQAWSDVATDAAGTLLPGGYRPR